PEIKSDQRSAGQYCADDDRKNIPARNCAHKKTPLRPGTTGAAIVSHGAVKTALSLRSGKPNPGAKNIKRVTMVSDGLTSALRQWGPPARVAQLLDERHR